MIYPPLTATSSLYAGALNGEASRTDEYGNPSGPLMTQRWLAGAITTEEFGREHLRLIEQDVAAGAVPWDVRDFSELHNFVDANDYTLQVCGCDMSDAGSDLANAVQDWVARALRGDRPSSLDYPPEWHQGRRARHREVTPQIWLEYVAAQNQEVTR